jgi:hypothetical protein
VVLAVLARGGQLDLPPAQLERPGVEQIDVDRPFPEGIERQQQTHRDGVLPGRVAERDPQRADRH